MYGYNIYNVLFLVSSGLVTIIAHLSLLVSTPLCIAMARSAVFKWEFSLSYGWAISRNSPRGLILADQKADCRHTLPQGDCSRCFVEAHGPNFQKSGAAFAAPGEIPQIPSQTLKFG